MEINTVNADISALQEVKLSWAGCRREASWIFYWSELTLGVPRRARVAFAIKNEMASKLTVESKANSIRLISLEKCSLPTATSPI